MKEGGRECVKEAGREEVEGKGGTVKERSVLCPSVHDIEVLRISFIQIPDGK